MGFEAILMRVKILPLSLTGYVILATFVSPSEL